MTEITADKYMAVSDESCILTLSLLTHNIEILPMCNPDLKQVEIIEYDKTAYYFIVDKNSISFSTVTQTRMDNYRLKPLQLDECDRVDRMCIVGE